MNQQLICAIFCSVLPNHSWKCPAWVADETVKLEEKKKGKMVCHYSPMLLCECVLACSMQAEGARGKVGLW